MQTKTILAQYYMFVFSYMYLREGIQKKTANYPHFVDKGGGVP